MHRDGQEGQDIRRGRGEGFEHGEITKEILGACFEVAAELGSGFLESVYERALEILLRQKGLWVQRQVALEVGFRGECVGEYYADMLVENKVIVELKAVKALVPEHLAQTINYLNATGLNVALLINFGMPRLEYRRLYRGNRYGEN